jgi:surface carbohydrate biosynthesis protein (TIGR04326 family)
VADSVFVWDAEGRPPDGDWTPVLWRGFADKATPGVVSMPTLVEDRAAVLKAAYLGWIYELGEYRFSGRRLLDHLELRPGFSYWWMTLVAEKCNWAKSPQITDAIRLFALEHWLTGRPVARLILASCSKSLAECMQSVCDRKGIPFEWHRIKPDAVITSWRRRLYGALPLALQALAWLAFYLTKRWPLKGVGLEEWRRTKGSVTFISYLFNLGPEATRGGRFESRYWAHLPEVLRQEGCDTNWLHIYVSDALLPSAGSAADAVRQFNRAGRGRQIHTTLEAFLNLRLIIRTVRDWLRLAWIGRRVTPALFSTRGGDFRLWPLFQDDWRRSMSGPAAIRNVLLLNLYEAAMASLPCQRAGIYLYENDPTEFALIHAWEAAGHNRLIGSQHSTMLYWDMRYVFDPRSYARANRNDLPMPDQVAVNGPAARDACLLGGYPAERVIEVEALRYLYLAGSRTRTRTSPSAVFRLLVLGDYVPDNTRAQMRMLEAAVHLLSADILILVKPHPSCPINSGEYPGLRMEVTTQALSALLEACDMAFTSNATSAVVDAYCAGVPVVSLLDPKAMNLSPLRGCEAARFVCTPEELALAIGDAASVAERQVRPQAYFTVDPELPRWRKLLLEPTI